MTTFQWPHNKRAALSLSLDDARPSQLDNGLPILNSFGVRATFYVSPPAMEAREGDWRAAAQTHEIGNHTLTHPCSGNFPWSRHKALEDFTLEGMVAELVSANEAIRKCTGALAETFAYPCGQTFVRRGVAHRSYVPLVAQRFLAGRGYLGESANDPTFCDLALLIATSFDLVSFEQIQPALENALQSGSWLIFVGHDVGDQFARQAVRPATLEAVCRFALGGEFWVDTVANVARHVRQNR